MNPISEYIYLLRQIWTYLWEKKLHFVIAYLSFIIANVARLFEPFVFGLAINELQKWWDKAFDNFIFYLIILWILRWIFIILHHFVGRIRDSMSALEAFKNYKLQFYNMVTRMPLERNQNNHSWKIIEQIRKWAESLNNFWGRNFSFIEVMIEISFSIVFVIALFWIFGWIILLSWILTFIISIVFDKILVYYYKWDTKNDYETNSLLFDYISNIFTNVTLRLEKVTSKNIEEKLIEKKKKLFKFFWWRELKRGVWVNILPFYSKLFILAWYVYFTLWTNGVVLIWTLTMLAGYLDQVSKWFSKFNNLYGDFVMYKSNLELSNQIKQDYEKLVWGKIKENNSSVNRNFKNLEIKNLNYKYSDNSGGVKKVNLNLNKWQKIAFVWESWSGKTTVMKILRWICNHDSWKLFLDNKLKKFDNIFDLTTLIPQEPEIFESTLEHNITFWIKTKNYKKDLENALKIAAFDRVVNRIPNWLNAKINEKWVNLSGWEKQRLAFARWVYFAKNSEIILLDEPTSSVDPYNENKIYDRVFEYFKDKIIISSVHKLNLLEKFDYIYKFESWELISHWNYNKMKNKI